MSKVRMVGVAVAAAGILLGGSGLASAAVIPLEPGVEQVAGTGTGGDAGTDAGSSKAVTDIVKALSSGSSGKKTGN
ncbi:hypothetical protein [Nocardia arthritidis]|uniref:Secreted protein n=1 Tax=Nocardia arthritidis TaxID=228602 RepID=A0A6G9YTY7_9NOCA|nr:hypothetical protein [Nocardia arthritidis]QIS16561.1 hypothetical protein F5544_43790 [Nocardia arthritidis]